MHPPRPEDVPRWVACTWPDLTDWAQAAAGDIPVTIPDQGLDHAVAMVGDSLARAGLDEAYINHAPIEAAILAELGARTTTAIPQVLRLSEDHRLALYTRVAGQMLTPQRYLSMSASQRRQVARALADALRALHTADVTAEPFSLAQPWFDDQKRPLMAPRALPAKVVALQQRAAEVLPYHLDSAALKDAWAMLEGIEQLLSPSRTPRLIHGDVQAEHLLISPSGQLGIIDFSDMTLGDPAVDFSHLNDIDPRLADAVLEEMPTGLYDGDLLQRAWDYARWDAVFLLVDHLTTGRTSAEVAWEMFAQARDPVRPGARD